VRAEAMMATQLRWPNEQRFFSLVVDPGDARREKLEHWTSIDACPMTSQAGLLFVPATRFISPRYTSDVEQQILMWPHRIYM
jgi:hypothetical protein